MSTVRGKFVYFKNGKTITYCGYQQKVNAGIYQDTGGLLYIIGTIPKKYQVTDTVFAITCLEEVPRDLCFGEGASHIYKLKCIEEHP